MNDGIDIGDLLEGFQTGKSIALSEWAFRKEERAFEALCRRLCFAKWIREVRAEGAERWERVKAAWRARDAKRSAKARARWEASLKVRACPHCGTNFPTKLQPGRPQKWCSRSCKSAARYARRDNMQLEAARKKREAKRAALPPVFCESCGVAVERRTTKPRRFCEKRTCIVKAYRLRNLAACRERDRARRCATASSYD